MEWQLDVVLFHEHTKAESLVHKGNDEAMPLSAKSLIESLAVSMETGVLS